MNWIRIAALLCIVFYHHADALSSFEALDKRAETIRISAESWLWNNFQSNGLFLYEYNFITGKQPRKNNTIRQLMAGHILARRAGESPEMLERHRSNMRFFLNNWQREDAFGAYIYFNNKSKLGANAMFLRCLVASPDYHIHKELASKVYSGILALQGLDGAFKPWYHEPGYAYDADYLLTFYSGEALLAMIEYYEREPDAKILSDIRRSLRYYHHKYILEMDENYYPAYVPWYTLAYYKYLKIDNDSSIAEGVFLMNDQLLELQDTRQVVGRFYNPLTPQYGKPHAASDSIYIESLAYALKLARAYGESTRERNYLRAISIGVDYLDELQFRQYVPGKSGLDPLKAQGSIPNRLDSKRTRVDNMQHCVDAMEAVSEALKFLRENQASISRN